jgi:hypothetical protein
VNVDEGIITVLVFVALGGTGVFVLVTVLVAVGTTTVPVAVKISSGDTGIIFFLFEQDENARISAMARVPANKNCFFMFFSFYIIAYLPPK